jgi:glyoxylase-like metal-dependent hydrolase (beta-lactamase superfamily II)
MTAIRQQGRINESTVLIDIGMYGVAGAAAVYLIEGDKKCLIDGGTRSEAYRLIKILRKLGAFPPDMIIVTHSHYDHTQGIPILQREAAKIGKRIGILASKQAIPLLQDQSWNEVLDAGPYEGIKNVTPLKENDTVDLGKIKLRIYEVPGHSKDHIAIMDEEHRNIFIGDAIGDKVADRTFLPPFMPPFWDPDAFLSTINKLKQIDYDTLCLSHFGYIYGDEAKHILDEALQVCQAWWQVFDKNSDKLVDIDYLLETIMREINPGVPDMKLLSLKLRVLFALMTGWRKLARKSYEPVGVLLLRGILKQLTSGYKTYQKPG